MSPFDVDFTNTVACCRHFGIAPSKGLGQNFLLKTRDAERIAALLELQAGATVLEIGAGLGCLSEVILQGQHSLVSLEIDPKLEAPLRQRLAKYPAFQLVIADCRELDWAELLPPGPRAYFCANIPYYISSTIVNKALVELSHAQSLVLLLQKEATERFLAPPNSSQYGPSNVLAALYGALNAGPVFPAGAFYPQPTVRSQVLVLQRQNCLLSTSAAENYALFSFLQACFAMRRKTIANNLKSILLSTTSSPAPLSLLEDICLQAKIEPQKRPEQIQPLQFYQLWQQYQQLITNATF